VDGSFGGLAQVRLQLGEGLLDRVEVGTVGREEEQPGTDRFDGGAHGRSLVARQIVHDDDVAGRELRRQDASHVGGEGIGVHGSVEHPRRDHAGPAQAGDEGRGLPVTVRHASAQSLSSRGPAVTSRHVGRRPGFVDEDQRLGVEVELAVEPLLTSLQDVGAVLLGRVRRLFLRVIPRRLKNRQIVPSAT